MINGASGQCSFGGSQKESLHGLRILSYGDNVGVCLQYKSQDDILGDLIDADPAALANRPADISLPDHRANLMQNLKEKLASEERLEDIKERIGILLYKDGIPLEI